MNLEALKISPKKIEVLHQMNLYTTHDLLTHYPYRYEIMEEKERSTWQKDDRVVLEAVIISAARVIRLRGKQSMTRFKVLYQEEEFQATIFNRPWTSAFQVGKRMTFVAKYDGKQGLSILSCNAQPLAEQLGYQPVYSLKEGISQKDFQKYIQKALINSSDALDEGGVLCRQHGVEMAAVDDEVFLNNGEAVGQQPPPQVFGTGHRL